MAGAVSSGIVHSNGKSHAPAEVDSTPVLTRLTASPACRQPARQHLGTLFGRGHSGKFCLLVELLANSCVAPLVCWYKDVPSCDYMTMRLLMRPGVQGDHHPYMHTASNVHTVLVMLPFVTVIKATFGTWSVIDKRLPGMQV